MPATEQTWRNSSTMHAVFAAASLVMFLATIWMFVVDHNREWKTYQNNSFNLDAQSCV